MAQCFPGRLREVEPVGLRDQQKVYNLIHVGRQLNGKKSCVLVSVGGGKESVVIAEVVEERQTPEGHFRPFVETPRLHLLVTIAYGDQESGRVGIECAASIEHAYHRPAAGYGCSWGHLWRSCPDKIWVTILRYRRCVKRKKGYSPRVIP